MDSVDRNRIRLVDRVVLHGGPLTFAALAERVITDRTRYLVLDLDRTVHLGRNMGELLGWEVGAHQAFGPDELGRMEAARKGGRLIFDRSRPLRSLRYLWLGARTWAAPGLYYLLFGKVPARNRWLRQWTFRRFGPEPMRTVQRVPQEALFECLKGLPDEVLEELAERVWDRHGDEQVISREDLDALRQRHPGLRIVVSSASPRPVVEVARRRLGADQAEWSEPGRINSGPAKIARLAERFPDVRDPDVEIVGVTDTGYGEDHCWAEHFTRVVDVNSDSPFPPLVSRQSPLEEIHSADVLTRRERDLHLFGEASWQDPRRPRSIRERTVTFERPALAERLGDLLDRANELAEAPEHNAFGLALTYQDARERLDREGTGQRPNVTRTSGATAHPA